MTCAPGRACHIACKASSACNAKTLTCANGERCFIGCEKKDACNGTSVAGAGASALCLDCPGNQPNAACVSLTCAVPTSCFRDCGSGGMSCQNIGDCGSCSTNNCPGL